MNVLVNSRPWPQLRTQGFQPNLRVVGEKVYKKQLTIKTFQKSKSRSRSTAGSKQRASQPDLCKRIHLATGSVPSTGWEERCAPSSQWKHHASRSGCRAGWRGMESWDSAGTRTSRDVSPPPALPDTDDIIETHEHVTCGATKSHVICTLSNRTATLAHNKNLDSPHQDRRRHTRNISTALHWGNNSYTCNTFHKASRTRTYISCGTELSITGTDQLRHVASITMSAAEDLQHGCTDIFSKNDDEPHHDRTAL